MDEINSIYGITIPPDFKEIPNREFQYLVLDFIHTSRTDHEQSRQVQGQILNMLKASLVWENKPSQIPPLPIQDIEVFNAFDSALANDKNGKCKEYLVSKLINILAI